MAKSGCDFVLLGATGFIGSHIEEALRNGGYSLEVSRLRLHQREALKDAISNAAPKFGVICAAGSRGTPNVDWCLANPAETVDINITGQLNVAAVCKELGNMHCTLIGSGLVYQTLPPERIKDGKFWDEEEDPVLAADYVDGVGAPEGQNFEVSVGETKIPTKIHIYRKLRCQLEDLLQYYDNVLNLRVLYPVSMKDKTFEDKRSLIGKLRHFNRIDPAEMSCTFLDDLCPLIPGMVKKKVVGNVNFANPGSVRYLDVVELLKKKVDGYDPAIGQGAGRGNILVNHTKLCKICGPEQAPRTAQECLQQIFA